METTTRPRAKIPPLENGDRLTRAEFERRYEAMPHLKKAELLDGVVSIPSPAHHRAHSQRRFNVIGWLGQYAAFTSGVRGAAHSSLRMDLDNEPQPDALLRLLPSHGGQCSIDAEGYVSGAPELIVEVTASRASYDLGVRLNAYRRNGVPEYVVWRVQDAEIDWFILREGAYERLSPDAAGVYRGEIFPGLWLDTAALLRDDLAAVLRTLHQGLASPEHAGFVTRIEETAAGS